MEATKAPLTSPALLPGGVDSGRAGETENPQSPRAIYDQAAARRKGQNSETPWPIPQHGFLQPWRATKGLLTQPGYPTPRTHSVGIDTRGGRRMDQ